MQSWPLSGFQNILLETRKKLNQTEKRLFDLQNNPILIGFIYTQIPDQPEPYTLWPRVEGRDITSEYAGLFFRAEGGN
jgi:hypothetical protein